MAKGKGRHNSRTAPAATDTSPGTGKKRAMDISTALQEAADAAAEEAAAKLPPQSSIWQLLYAERQGISWVLGCAVIGWLGGFGIGTGHFTGSAGLPVSPWRIALGMKIRSTNLYQVVMFQTSPFPSSKEANPNLRNDPSHPRVFSVLREAVVRENNGYVHPDLGFLVPAPSGAARGLGMVRSSFNHCQSRCMPGLAEEKKQTTPDNHTFVLSHERPIYSQEEVLLRIPLNYQITRTVAINTLNLLVSLETHRTHPLTDLDDAALLVMFLAHERGLSRASRWLPYIASLPTEPTCGYSMGSRPHMTNAIEAMGEELGLDVNGWRDAVIKAGKYADRMAIDLAQDYGTFLRTPEGIPITANLQWALCHVASRAAAGSEKHGALRLVPMLDLINHDASAGAFVELTGKEKISKFYCRLLPPQRNVVLTDRQLQDKATS
jgi:hypothetical protein